MAINEEVIRFKKYKTDANGNHSLVSQWTRSDTIEMIDGKTLEEALDGATGIVEILQADYDKLTEEEKNNGQIYHITDVQDNTKIDASDISYKDTNVNEQLETLDDEINDLKKSVSDGKSSVASAITDKGVTTASDATFETMAENISLIIKGDVDYIAPLYDISVTYNKGDIVLYGELTYKCIENDVTGLFDETKWEIIYLTDVGDSDETHSGGENIEFIAPEFSEEITYSKGDTVLKDGVLYELTTDTFEGEFDSNNWVETKLVDMTEKEINYVAPPYDSTEIYNTDDVVYHKGVVYKCLEDNVSGNFNIFKWQDIHLCDLNSNLGTKIYYLGNGNSFDIKSKLPEINYKNLSSDNFIIKANSVAGSSSHTGDFYGSGAKNYSWSGNSSASLNVSYDSNNGIATISGTSCGWNTRNGTFASTTGSGGASVSCGLYLVIGEIETA